MLPYSGNEIKKYNFSIFKIKMVILKFLLDLSFKKSAGIIFLSRVAKKTILTKLNYKKSIIIGHGGEKNKFLKRDKKNNLNFIYVSNTDPYKNHLFLIRSIYDIETNKKVLINFVGEEGKCHLEVKNSIDKFNKKNQNIKIKFLGPLKYQSLKSFYLNSQGMIFCSTCENFPNIILEGMSYGLPILCPNISPLNEIVEKNDFYYKVNNHKSLKNKMIKFIENSSLRNNNGYKNFISSKKFNWRKTSAQTFSFIEDFI